MDDTFEPLSALMEMAGQETSPNAPEHTPEHIQKALRELVLRYEGQSDQARREYVRRCLKLHEFFRGNQYLWWDPRVGAYRAPTQTGGLMAGATPNQVQNMYTINIFQGFLMANLAILSANHPTVRAFPMKANAPEDENVAKKANDFLRIFEKQSKESDRLQEQIYLLWCDGTIGSYVHNEVNGDKYGYIEEPVYEEIETTIGFETYQCLACGSKAGENTSGMCPGCGAPYSDQSVIPPPTVSKQVQVDIKRIPRSKVVWDVVGGLEMKLPPAAKDQSEFPFLIRAREINKALVRAAYPELADKINGSDSPSGTDNSIERRARRQLSQGLTTEQRAVLTNQGEDVTYKEIWLRPWAFFQLDDKALREELISKYPDGCYVAFADEVFLEARSEKMDDHWRVCHAMPGRGQIREPIGGALVQLQEIVNDLYNLVRDVIEFTLPATFVDNEVLDIDKWSRSNVMAGAAYNVRAKPGRAVSDAFWQTQPGQLPQYTTTLMQELRTDIPQFILGTFPAAFGGHTPGNATAALDVDTLIPTPSGFVRNGDLEVGGKVFGEDGKPYDILAVHPIFKSEAYRITFDNGAEVVADAKHRWRTYTAKEREQIGNRVNGGRKKKPGKTGPKPLPLPLPGVRTTEEIAQTLLDRRGRSNHVIPIAKPFSAPSTDFPIDPYILGVWLGDGASAHGLIAASDEDGPGMAERFAELGYELKKLKSPFSWYAKGLRTKLRKLGVLNNKHIPEEYFWGSPEQRIALLQGLMDTDGCATTEGKQVFTNTNKVLVDGVYRLAASVGCKPRLFEIKSASFYSPEYGKEYVRSKAWGVAWSGTAPVFRMPRKAARVSSDRRLGKLKYRYIVAVEPVGEREVRCITVSNPTECFLCTKDFITTSNSGIALERDAAMGRLGLFWRTVKEHYAQVAPLIVQQFALHGMEPEMITETTEGGSFVNVEVSPEDFSKGQIQTYWEVVEDFPTTWAQRQGLLMNLMGNPMFQGAIAKLSNLTQVKQTLGVTLEMPGEQAYGNAWKVIEKLITEEPVPQQDPMTGEVMGMTPSVQPGPLDDYTAVLEACKDFDQSERADKLRDEKSPGYENFLLYAAELMKAMAPPPMPGAEGPDGGAPPEAGSGPPPPEMPNGPVQ